MLKSLFRKDTPTQAPAPASPATHTIHVTAKLHAIYVDFIFAGQIEELQWNWQREGLTEAGDSNTWPAFFVYGQRLSPELLGLRLNISELSRRDRNHEMNWLLGPDLWQRCQELVEAAKSQPFVLDSVYEPVTLQLTESEWQDLQRSCRQVWQEWRDKTYYRIVLYSRRGDGRRHEEKSHSVPAFKDVNYWRRSYNEMARLENNRQRHSQARYGDTPRHYWVEVS